MLDNHGYLTRDRTAQMRTTGDSNYFDLGRSTPGNEAHLMTPDESSAAQPAVPPDGIQRRENVRVQVTLPITVSLDGHPSAENRTRDLSATGMGFSTRLPVKSGDMGTVTIHFSDWKFTKTFVVRFAKPILAGTQCGAEFVDLHDDEYRKLVKEVFNFQRAQLHKKS